MVGNGRDHSDGDQAIAIGVREAAEEDAVGHAEDGAGGADAEGESERGGDGKGGRAAQAAQGKAQLPRGSFGGGHDGADVHAAGILVDDGGAAELFVRGGQGVARAHSLLFEFGGTHFHVRPHFVAQIAIEVARAPPGQPIAHVNSNTLPTPRLSEFH